MVGIGALLLFAVNALSSGDVAGALVTGSTLRS